MKVWQIIVVALLGIAAFVGVIFGVVFYATSGITDTTDQFFAAAYEGDYETAHSLTSQQFQAGTNVEQLGEYLEQFGLNKVTDTSWSSRSIENNIGELRGTVTTETGGAIPTFIQLVHEQDEWRITFIDVPDTSVSGASGNGRPSGTSAAAPEANPRIDPEAKAIVDAGLPGKFWLTTAWEDEDDFTMLSIKWKGRPSAASLAQRYGYGANGVSREEAEALDDARAVVEVTEFNEAGQLVVQKLLKIPSREVRTLFTYEQDPGGPEEWVIVDLEIDWGG